MKLRLATFAVSLAFCLQPVRSAVLHESPPNPLGGGMLSEFQPSNFNVSEQRADDFTIVSSSVITSLSWWGQYAFLNTPSAPDDFTVRIFSEVGDTPSLQPIFELPAGNIGRTLVGFQSFGSDVYAYSLNLPEKPILDSGRYWLSIVNDTATDPDDRWYWQRTSLSSGWVSERELDGTDWQPYGPSTLAFRVEGFAVPEPGTLGLLFLGSILMIAFRALKRR